MPADYFIRFFQNGKLRIVSLNPAPGVFWLSGMYFVPVDGLAGNAFLVRWPIH